MSFVSGLLSYWNFTKTLKNLDLPKYFRWKNYPNEFVVGLSKAIIAKTHISIAAALTIGIFFQIHIVEFVHRIRMYYLKPSPNLDNIEDTFSEEKKTIMIWEYDDYHNFSFWSYFNIYHMANGFLSLGVIFALSFILLTPGRYILQPVSTRALNSMTKKYIVDPKSAVKK